MLTFQSQVVVHNRALGIRMVKYVINVLMLGNQRNKNINKGASEHLY